MATTDIKTGDKVYFRVKAGMFPRTLSGTVLEINEKEYEATVEVHTQNIWGKKYNIHLSRLHKSKKQN